MTAQTFPTTITPVTTTVQALLLGRAPDRLPLEAALQLAHEVVAALVRVHESGVILGQLDPSSLELEGDGEVHALSGRGAVVAPELLVGGTATVASDVYAAGCVLFEILTGLSPAQARGRLALTSLHAMPVASHFNPTLDEKIDRLVAAMVARDPAARPPTMLHVEAQLLEAFDELGLEPDRAAVVALVSPLNVGKRDRIPTDRFVPVVMVPAAVAVPAAPVVPRAVAPVAKAAKAAPKKQVRHVPPPTWLVEDEEEDEVVAEQPVRWSSPLRFDAWAVGALAFTLAAFVFALSV